MTPEKAAKMIQLRDALKRALASLEISVPRTPDKELKRRMLVKIGQVDQTLAMLRDKLLHFEAERKA